jgi:hypothetical protein
MQSWPSKIDRHLPTIGSDKTRLLRRASGSPTFAVRRDERDLGALGRQGHTPARATVEARLADPRYLAEIIVKAAAE